MKSLNWVTEIARDWIGASQDLERGEQINRQQLADQLRAAGDGIITETQLANMENAYGGVMYKGKKYIQRQSAHLTGTHDEPYYEAYAYGLDYKTYLVKWVITADINSTDYDVDNSDAACDWAHPISVTRC